MRPSAPLPWLVLLTLAFPLAPTTRAEEKAARHGKRSLSFEELDDYIGRAFAHTEDAHETLNHMAKLRLVAHESRKRGIEASAQQVNERLRAFDRRLRASGRPGLQDYLEREGIDREAFVKMFREKVLLEEIVRQDLGLPPGKSPSDAQQQLWLSDRARSLRPEPPAADDRGVVARVLGEPIRHAELGRTLRLNLDPQEIRKYLVEAFEEKLVRERARRARVRVEPSDVEAEIQRRRRDIARSPQLEGTTLEELLRREGHSLASYRRDPRLRTLALLTKTVVHEHSKEEWRQLYHKHKSEFDRRFGEERRFSWIYLRATDDRDHPVVRLSYETSTSTLRELKARIESGGVTFALAANATSQHSSSRPFGGRMGWVRRVASKPDPKIVEQVFALELGMISAPIRLEEAVAIVRVDEISSRPEEAGMVERVRRAHVVRAKSGLLSGEPFVTYLD